MEESTAKAAEIISRLIQLAPETFHKRRWMDRHVRRWRIARAKPWMVRMRSAEKKARARERPIAIATRIGGNI